MQKPTKISAAAVAQIMAFEGFRSKAYKCAAGVWTIGYGHTAGVRQYQLCTKAQAHDWLLQDLAKAEAAVIALEVCETQGQYDALTDFVFNLGANALRKSTLLKKIRAAKAAADTATNNVPNDLKTPTTPNSPNAGVKAPDDQTENTAAQESAARASNALKDHKDPKGNDLTTNTALATTTPARVPATREREIRAQFLRWIYADGKPLDGLRRRRQWEADTFFS